MNAMIDVVLPTFNDLSNLKNAIECVRNQTFRFWRLYVIDNYSTDGTWDYLTTLTDERITSLRLKNKGCIAKSRNYGIVHGSAPYISFLDSDDIWFENKLDEMLKLMLETDSHVSCHAQYWTTENKSFPVFYGSNNQSIHQTLLYRGNCLGTSATMVRRDYIQAAGLFPEDARYITAEDYFLWIALSEITDRFIFSKQILGCYQINPNGQSRRIRTHNIAVRNVINKYFCEMDCLKPYDNRLFLRRMSIFNYGKGRQYLKNKEFRIARLCFQKSLGLNLYSFKQVFYLILSILKISQIDLRKIYNTGFLRREYIE